MKSYRIESGPSGLISLFCYLDVGASMWCVPLWLCVEGAVVLNKKFLFWSLVWSWRYICR